jgi:hypothetical protein
MSIILLEDIIKRQRASDIYIRLMNEPILNNNLVNILVLENIWSSPLDIGKIVKIIEEIKTGSIVIYIYANLIEELLPITNIENKDDIIEFLKIRIPDIVPSQWKSLKREEVIKKITEYKHLEYFREKIIFDHK